MCHRRALQASLPRAPPTHPSPRPAGRARVGPVCGCVGGWVSVLCVYVCMCVFMHNVCIYTHNIYIYMEPQRTCVFLEPQCMQQHRTIARARTNDTPLCHLSNVYPIECVFYRYQLAAALEARAAAAVGACVCSTWNAFSVECVL